jgi:hypothetical protein
MEKLTCMLVIIGFSCATPALARQAVLRQLGASSALATQDDAAPMPSFGGLRALTVPAGPTPRKLRLGAPPAYGLPQGPARPALAQVATGGTLRNFDGMTPGAGAAGVGGAVGAQQFVQLAAGRMAIYRKHDGALQAGPFGVHALFAGSVCGAPQGATGSVLYDPQARRWIIAQLAAGAGQPLCLAVSRTADAAGSYVRYALRVAGAGRAALIADDARMALWGDALFVSLTLFDHAHGAFQGSRACAIERAALMQGRDAALRCSDAGSEFGALLVATEEGAARPPPSLPAPLLALDAAGRLLLWRWPLAGAPLVVPVAPFRPACGDACIAQPWPGGKLSAPGERLLPRAAWRGGALVLAHAVQERDGRTGLRWYELRALEGAPYVYQQGTHAPDGEHRSMGSIGLDRAGNIALGYSVAGPATPPGVRYSGRSRSDPPGRMAGEEVVVNGAGVQSSDARLWAASGALSLDPDDGCTFWYTQLYLPHSGNLAWRSRIASFKFRNCS